MSITYDYVAAEGDVLVVGPDTNDIVMAGQEGVIPCTPAFAAITVGMSHNALVLRRLDVQSSGVPGVPVGGTVAGHTDYEWALAEGSPVTLTAVAVFGDFRFLRWMTPSGETVSADPLTTFTLAEDVVVVAEYEQKDWVRLTVRSSNDLKVQITGSLSGTTPFSHDFLNGTEITLTGPASVGGLPFAGWRSSSGILLCSEETFTFTITTGKTLVVAYEPYVSNLRVESSGAKAVRIEGTAPGTTDYEMSITQGAFVTLVAPLYWSGHRFVEWRDAAGVSICEDVTLGFEIEGDTTVAAAYVSVPHPVLTVTSSGVSGVSISGTVAGVTDYSVELLAGTSVALTAPEYANGHLFMHWQDASGDTVAPDWSFGFTITSNTTLVACYRSEISKLLTIDSWPAGAPIGGTHPGTTPYAVYVEEGTTVEVVAPWHNYFSFFRAVFAQWEDASGSVLSDRASYSLTVTQDTSLFADFSAHVMQFYVNDSIAENGVSPGDNSNSGTSPNSPMATIQGLFERYGTALEFGSTVHVSPGIYRENISIWIPDGVSITGAGADVTCIDGGRQGPCLVERDNWGGFLYSYCFVSGFTFTGGLSDKGAGISCYGKSTVTIRNCLITGNEAIEGGGIYCGDSSRPTIENCTVTKNTAQSGGGICSVGSSAPTIRNCIIWGNSAEAGSQMAHVRTTPDNIYIPDAIVKWCDVEGGLDGLYLPRPSTLTWGDGNINTDPLFADPDDNDYHLKSEEGRWKPNTAGGEWVKDDVTSPCIDSGDPKGDVTSEAQPNASIPNMGAYGNTANASLSSGTCTLTVISNGFDAQFSGYPSGLSSFSANVKIGMISITASWTSQYLSDGKAHPLYRWADTDGNTLCWQGTYRFTVTGDTTLVAEYLYGHRDFYINDGIPDSCVAIGDNRNPGTSPQAPMALINSLLDRYPKMEEGSTIHVSPGVYAGGVFIQSRDNSYRGLNIVGAGRDQTIVQAHGSPLPCLLLIDFSGIIKGFRFNGGTANKAASGVCCMGSSPLIEDCMIDGGSQTMYVASGALYRDSLSAPIIRNNIIMGNGIPSGGAVFFDGSSPIILSCIIRSNTGAGIACVNGAAPLIQDNIIEDNHPQGYPYGSGVYCVASSPVIECNVIARNSNINGGGIYADKDSAPVISNNLIASNHAVTGGGLYLEGTASLRSCTIAGNTADSAGGAVYGNGAAISITNGILWGNAAPSGPQAALAASSLTVNHSDVAGGIDAVAADEASGPVTWGTGTIDADPRFADPANGDYRLLPGSPCIDAGTNLDVQPGETDAAGLPRIIDGNFDGAAIVDMGAFEHLPGDLDRDGRITILDLLLLRNNVGRDPASGGTAPWADVNADGQINLIDLILVRGRLSRQ
ncbi:MAG TPA: right-handed parallel beta-helix repeat-containing protein [Planctomycetota bacterium]|nr:right-handed parallel beta-helix repeat-containing protein [Planctomycetota bacterium]